MSVQKEFREGPGRTTYYWLASAGMVLTAIWLVVKFVFTQFASSEDLITFCVLLGVAIVGGVGPLVLLVRFGATAQRGAAAASGAILCLACGILILEIELTTKVASLTVSVATVVEKSLGNQSRMRSAELETIAAAIRDPSKADKLDAIAKAHFQFASELEAAENNPILRPRSWLDRKGIFGAFMVLLAACGASLTGHMYVLAIWIETLAKKVALHETTAPRSAQDD